MKKGAGIKHEMYQRNNTPAASMPTILPMYLGMPERCPPGQKRRDRFLGRRPFFSENQHRSRRPGRQEQQPQKAEAKAAGSRHQHPAPGRDLKPKEKRTHTREGRPPGQPGNFSPCVSTASLVLLVAWTTHRRYFRSSRSRKPFSFFRRCFERFSGRRQLAVETLAMLPPPRLPLPLPLWWYFHRTQHLPRRA